MKYIDKEGLDNFSQPSYHIKPKQRLNDSSSFKITYSVVQWFGADAFG